MQPKLYKLYVFLILMADTPIHEKAEKMRKLREKKFKKRYNVTLDKADSEELQIFLQTNLSESLQFVTHEFLEDYKDEMEEYGDWEEPKLTKEQRKVLDAEYKEHPERWATIEHYPEMKKRRIEKGRYNLIMKEKRYSKTKKGEDQKK